jgi:hypothetical protein
MPDTNTELTQAFDAFFKASDAMKKVFDDSAMTPEQAAQHQQDVQYLQRLQHERILAENARLDAELEKELEDHDFKVVAVPIPQRVSVPTKEPVAQSILQPDLEDEDVTLTIDDDLDDELLDE